MIGSLILGPIASGFRPPGAPPAVSTAGLGFRAIKTDGNQLTTANVVATVLYNSVDSDIDGYDPLTGIFTVPESLNGKYMRFTAGAKGSQATNGFALYINQAGSIVQSVIGSVTTSWNATVVATPPIQVVTGQEFLVQYFCQFAGNIEQHPSTFFVGEVLD